ncbi:hypothetical protein GA830_00805 [Mesorhizobium sp. NBSH29]|uniref:YdeI/OmpD-associated family protein n=1 Tax=Mesorhizobium sp. NBSH29 TaxID=2654249 RepID=UPI0018968446|nr:YdeI/OmpD-associated family protein [Mesorhizobium sp. NBSH29]QPC85445.1 hypothetical protein GA830_00805 [Mesorhizobium sp. NBSH29]
MAPFTVNSDRVHVFEDARSFEDWLRQNHAGEPEIWIKMHKKASGLVSIDWADAVDVALCWGWIDAIRKSFDKDSFLQRLTPRGKKSIWSKVNVAHVARLIEEGRMTEHGLRHVEAAQADGRWDNAYAGSKEMKIPPELQSAIDAVPQARATFDKLNAQNRFALAFQIGHLKTEAGRRKKIATFVEMLKRGDTIHPQKMT